MLWISLNSSDEVTSTNSVQHSASSEWFFSHSFHWAYYFQFPTLFWTKFKRDKFPHFARCRSLLLKTNRFKILSSQTYKEPHLRFLGYQVVSLLLIVQILFLCSLQIFCLLFLIWATALTWKILIYALL